MSYRVQTWKLEEFVNDRRPLEHMEIRTLALEALERRRVSKEEAEERVRQERPKTKLYWAYDLEHRSYTAETDAGLVATVTYRDHDHEWRWSVSVRGGGRVAHGVSNTSLQAKIHAQHWLGVPSH